MVPLISEYGPELNLNAVCVTSLFRGFYLGCPVLESLAVKQCRDDNVNIFTIKVPSLKSLVLDKSGFEDTATAPGFMIDAPSLERFYIEDDSKGGFCVIENEMPNIVEADVDVAYYPGNILSSITSVKRLSLSSITSAKDAYPVGTIFCPLVYLEICTFKTEWLNVLMRVLKDSPNLRALKLDTLYHYEDDDDDNRPSWSEPCSVP
ncbi:PREDICTED: probable FBD-associated F-box protein At1g32375 [Camelina sativa]|uniref:Probable FBD-associated F-box protein At1g32375 n=1 Tax=Camelina sativa TaxID=90675 RepID=A0ABM0WUV0_CAMSA|nr:PREDICTED: probable FBD-associated F-box protein At1g32375 [Camelina sativa]